MTNKRMRDDIAFEEFTWRIENFTKLNSKKLYSDTFEIGSFTWRMLIFPKGKGVNYLSIYLDAAYSASPPKGWKKFARKLKLIDRVNSKMDITGETEHHFCAKESDWGFTQFVPLTQLQDPVSGYLLHGTCIIVAEISVNKPANEIAVNKATTITTPLKSDGQVGVQKVETQKKKIKYEM